MLATTKRRVETLESHVHHISEFSVRNTKSTTRRHTTKHKPWHSAIRLRQTQPAQTCVYISYHGREAQTCQSHQMPNS